MKRYRTKPCEIEAVQWFRLTPHSKVKTPFSLGDYADCKICKVVMKDHGWIATLEGGHIVCPYDYIIKGLKGEFYPCKPDVFAMKYEEVKYLIKANNES